MDLEQENRNKEKPCRNKIVFFLETLYKLRVLNGKTEFCKHKGSCIQNIIIGTGKSFLLSYLIRGLINCLGLLFSFKKLKKNPWLIIFAFINKDNFRFACFPGIYCFILKIVTCLSRLVFQKNAGFIDFLSGALAGLFSLMIQAKKSRSLWSLFLLARALDTVYKHLINKGLVRKFPMDYTLILAFSNILTGYAFAVEPDLNAPGINKFYMQFANMNTNDKILREAWIEKKKLNLNQ